MVAATTTPLPAARPSAFTDIGACGGGIGKARPGGGRRASGIRHFLGEGFAAFQPSSSRRWAEAFQPGGSAGISQTKRQRRFRPHHNQINCIVLAEGDKGRNILGSNRDTFRHFGNAGIAGRAKQLGQQRRCRQGPAERMFAATAAHHQNTHRAPRQSDCTAVITPCDGARQDAGQPSLSGSESSA
jgi:hypothetical protein